MYNLPSTDGGSNTRSNNVQRREEGTDEDIDVGREDDADDGEFAQNEDNRL